MSTTATPHIHNTIRDYLTLSLQLVKEAQRHLNKDDHNSAATILELAEIAVRDAEALASEHGIELKQAA